MTDALHVILGIGNPGKEYEETRHNCGFMVVDALARRYGISCDQKKWKSRYADLRLPPMDGGGRVLLVKPQTFVNVSGATAQGICTFFKIPPERMLVVVDDIHLGLGTLRLRAQGSSGGHNGLRDIESRLGKNYPRLRMGVGKPSVDQDQIGHVLGRFAPDEKDDAEKMIQKSCDCCLAWLRDGVDAALRFNGPLHPPEKKKTSPDKPVDSISDSDSSGDAE